MASGIPWYDRRDALVFWDEFDEPQSNLRHILDAGYTTEDVEHVLRSRDAVDVWNDGDAEFAVRGYTPHGEFVHIPYDVWSTDPVILYPRTIFPPEKLP
jgi:hypothetical protein